MGVIQRQGIKESMVRYFGVGLGFVNTLFIYTYCLHPDELGLIRFLQATVMLVMPFLMLGMVSIINRYFTFFRDQAREHNGFLFFALIVPLFGFLLFLVVSWIFWEDIIAYYSAQHSLYGKYLHFLVPMVFFELYRSIFINYSGVQFRIVVPSLISEVGTKVGIPLLVGLYYFGKIDFDAVITWMVIVYGLTLFAIILYVYRLGHLFLRPNFRIFTRSLVKEMSSFGFYAIVGSLGSVLATRIDAFMVGTLIDLESTAIFTLAAQVSAVIEIPQKSIEKISLPVIADAWRDDKQDELRELYRKTCLIQLIAGLWVFLGVWVSIDPLFSFIPKSEIYSLGKWVILILGLAKVLDMATGVNSLIISLSKYYRFNFYAILCLAVFNIVTNLLLIPLFKINGVALATLSSILLFNLVKFLFLLIKLKMQPFTWRNLVVVVIGVATYGIILLLPPFKSALLEIGVNSVLVTVLFFGSILLLRISSDLNQTVEKMWQKVNGER